MSVQWRQLSIETRDRIVAEVKRLFRGDAWPGWEEAARRYDLTSHVGLRAGCDADYADRRRGYRLNESPRDRRTALQHCERDHHGVAPPSPAEIAARLAEIPEDIRSPAERLLGSPIPGDQRRSVDKRNPVSLPFTSGNLSGQ